MFNKFIQYLSKKRSELEKLNLNDLLLAKLVLDVHRKKIENRFDLIDLYSIEPVHPIDRDNALSATQKRAEILMNN